MRIIKDNRAFMVIAAAIILPFIFALCALSLDLSVSLKDQTRLGDALREGVFYSTLTDKSKMESKISRLVKIYLNDDKKEISNIVIKKSSGQNEEEAPANFEKISAQIANGGIFSKFIAQKLESKNSYAYAKLEFTKDITNTDFIFAVSFTGLNIGKDSVKDKTSLCADDLLDNGICHPPLGEGKVIDAIQTISANVIKTAKEFDKENKQYYGFIPFNAASQVLGKDLTDEAQIDTEDGLSQDERDKAKYAVFPVNVFTDLQSGNYDVYSRFYPRVFFKTGVFQTRVLKPLEKFGVDISHFKTQPEQDFSLALLELSIDNPLLANYGITKYDIDVIQNYLDNRATGHTGVSSSDIEKTINGILNERDSVIYRLFNPDVDKVEIGASDNEIKDMIAQYEKAQGDLRDANASLEIIKMAIEHNNAHPINSSAWESAYKKRAKQKYEENVKEVFYDKYIVGDDGQYKGYDELYGACEDCADEIQYALEDGEFDKFENLVAKYKKEGKFPQTAPNIPPKPDPNAPVPPPTLSDVIQNMTFVKEEYEKTKKEKDKLEDNFLVKSCNVNFNDPFMSDAYKKQITSLCESEGFALVEKYNKVKDKFEQASKTYNAFTRLKSELSGTSKTDQELQSEYATQKQTAIAKIESIRPKLFELYKIKGKALCNVLHVYIASSDGACDVNFAQTLLFTEIAPKKIKNLSDIKKIDMLNKVPFKIENSNYLTNVGQDHDYGTVGLIRAAQMLANSSSNNKNAKILLFTNATNTDVDEPLIKAGLCQRIVSELKKRGKDAEIYAITLGMPSSDETQRGIENIPTIENYNRIWKACTPNVITGENITGIVKQINENVFKDMLGKITYE